MSYLAPLPLFQKALCASAALVSFWDKWNMFRPDGLPLTNPFNRKGKGQLSQNLAH